jgi:DNA-binding NarL/FixJ family response regulator
MPGPSQSAAVEIDALTLRILDAMARGRSTTGAAEECGVSLSTVRRRLDAAREAWGLGPNIQLVVHAVRRGLV